MSHRRGWTIRADERAYGLFENASRLIDGADVTALQFNEHLRAVNRRIKASAFADRNHLVVGAVEKQDRRGDPANLLNRIERAPHEEPQREERVLAAGEIHQ